MDKLKFRLAIAVILILVASNWFYARKAKAAPQITYGQPACTSYVPTNWGQLKGSSDNYGVIFEDSSGTLRFITGVPCGAYPQVSLEIRRGAPPN